MYLTFFLARFPSSRKKTTSGKSLPNSVTLQESFSPKIGKREEQRVLRSSVLRIGVMLLGLVRGLMAVSFPRHGPPVSRFKLSILILCRWIWTLDPESRVCEESYLDEPFPLMLSCFFVFDVRAELRVYVYWRQRAQVMHFQALRVMSNIAKTWHERMVSMSILVMIQRYFLMLCSYFGATYRKNLAIDLVSTNPFLGVGHHQEAQTDRTILPYYLPLGVGNQFQS